MMNSLASDPDSRPATIPAIRYFADFLGFTWYKGSLHTKVRIAFLPEVPASAAFILGGQRMIASHLPRLLIYVLALGIGLGFAPCASAEVVLPDQGKIDKVDFERHIMGLFGRMGCNSGS